MSREEVRDLKTLDEVWQSLDRINAMKQNKVLSDLRVLMDDIENKRVDIESYSYSFAYIKPDDYDENETGNEKIHIEFSRNDVE